MSGRGGSALSKPPGTGLTRPARINDNLPPAAAGSQSCAAAWIPSPGPWRRSVGHDPGTSGVPGEARRVCGGLGTGPDRTEACLGWARGSGQAALGGEGWGLGRGGPRRRAAASLRSCGCSRLHRGDPWPGWRLRPALAGWVAANESFRAARGAYAGARGETQERTGDSGCSNSALVPRARRPRGRFWGWPKGDSGVRAALRKVVADEHC